MRTARARTAFTLIELLIVMAIIIVLAGLILATSGYVQDKGKRSRAEAEIAAMSAALESYKADNGVYPSDPTATESVDPTVSPVPPTASKFLYGEITGDRDFDGGTDANAKSYMSFKPASLQRPNMSAEISTTNKVSAMRDPFGNPYGYSTAKAAGASGSIGFNPTYDLWSTAGGTDVPAKWIKNW
jgi:prepilin-type N-terminal cleavage/methylation domain-containing protein